MYMLMHSGLLEYGSINLCATLSASVTINYRRPIKVYYRICRHIRIKIINSNMMSFIGYINNLVIKLPIYFNSHMRIVCQIKAVQILNIIHTIFNLRDTEVVICRILVLLRYDR